ncbi:hypothetical protein [uncultured Arcobacter sp.]|uniref:hypothetical protein n=1 Tax=uncultured Arcobacter sp. TaxID=165434 RepID=UPI00261D1AF5|nr:hypothetical protein [uncultured Arcobacter sp.]
MAKIKKTGERTLQKEYGDDDVINLQTALKKFEDLLPYTDYTVKVDTIQELKDYDVTSIPNGLSVTIFVNGYYTAGDGGGGSFRWNGTSEEVDNGGTIIEPTAGGTGRWERIYSGAVNVRWFGAVGDGTTDNSTLLTSMTDSFTSIFVPEGDYRLSSTIFLPADTVDHYGDIVSKQVFGVGEKSKFLIDGGVIGFSGVSGSSDLSENWTFKGLGFDTYNADKVTYESPTTSLPSFGIAFNLGRMYRSRFEHCSFEFVKPFVQDSALPSSNSFIQQIDIIDCESTHHQEFFMEVTDAWDCNIVRTRLERGNRGIKIGTSDNYCCHGVNISQCTFQGNASPDASSDVAVITVNPTYDLRVDNCYFESNRDNNGYASKHIHVKATSDFKAIYNLSLTKLFMAQNVTDVDEVGADFYNVLISAKIDKELNFSDWHITGGNALRASNTEADIYYNNVSIIPVGSIYNEEIIGTLTGTGGLYSANVLSKLDISFSPVIADAVTGGNVSGSVATSAKCTKIGDLVFVQVQFNNIDTTGLTGTNILYIQGLPEASFGTHIGSVVLDNFTYTGSEVASYILNGTSAIQLRQSPSAGVDSSLTVDSISSGVSDLTLSIVYMV